ncbi:MAG: TetR/AcrR family transcriptional regulator [Pseudonocardia sp.]|nr:TetR/AcrR family transcriptional regulator [Pseudonocardia sp.]
MDQRTKLLEAAMICLQQRGYARTTTRDIVAEAGAHLPAVNYYFGSKERLLDAAITAGLGRWMDTTMATAPSDSPAGPAALLRDSLAGFLAALESNRTNVVAAAEAYAQVSRSEELRESLAAEYQRAAARVEAVVNETEGDDDPLDDRDRRGVTTVLLALFDGLAIQWLVAPDRSPDAEDVIRSLAILGSVLADEQ